MPVVKKGAGVSAPSFTELAQQIAIQRPRKRLAVLNEIYPRWNAVSGHTLRESQDVDSRRV